jgi:DNA-binding transcriptional LysR family regulator
MPDWYCCGMELRRLRYFLAVAREGSQGQASRVLGVAQPALGRQIQLLEGELGVKLFGRTAKGMRLTDEGEYLADAVIRPLEQLDLALSNLRSYSTRAEAAFTMGMPPGVSGLLAPRLFLRLRSEMPNLKLRFVEDTSAQLSGELLRETIDIAIVAGVTPDDRVFRSEVLREELLLTGAPDSALAGRERVRFSELHRFPLILPSAPDGLPTQLEKLAAPTGARIIVGGEVNSTELAKIIVGAGGGFAILPRLAIAEEVARGELIAAPVCEPAIERVVLYAVQPHWRVPRGTYNAVERIIFDEWRAVVESGEWPAEWLFDLRLLSTHATTA